MINKIKITNLADAESYSFNKNNRDYDVWISAVGSEDKKQINRMRKNFQEKNVKFFAQFFADWSDEDGMQWGHLEHEAPQHQHIQNIITFLKPFTEDDKPHELLKVRVEAWPNLRILGFASDILGIDIHGHVVNWKKRVMQSEEIFIPDRQQKTEDDL